MRGQWAEPGSGGPAERGAGAADVAGYRWRWGWRHRTYWAYWRDRRERCDRAVWRADRAERSHWRERCDWRYRAGRRACRVCRSVWRHGRGSDRIVDRRWDDESVLMGDTHIHIHNYAGEAVKAEDIDTPRVQKALASDELAYGQIVKAEDERRFTLGLAYP